MPAAPTEGRPRGHAGRLGPLLHRGLGVDAEVAEAVPALDRVVLDLLGAIGALLHGRPLGLRSMDGRKATPKTEGAGPRWRARPFGRAWCQLTCPTSRTVASHRSAAARPVAARSAASHRSEAGCWAEECRRRPSSRRFRPSGSRRSTAPSARRRIRSRRAARGRRRQPSRANSSSTKMNFKSPNLPRRGRGSP